MKNWPKTYDFKFDFERVKRYSNVHYENLDFSENFRLKKLDFSKKKFWKLLQSALFGNKGFLKKENTYLRFMVVVGTLCVTCTATRYPFPLFLEYVLLIDVVIFCSEVPFDVVVKTSKMDGVECGTECSPYLVIYGSNGLKSRPLRMENRTGNFEAGETSRFKVSTF